MPIQSSATSRAVKPFVDARKSGGITRAELAEIQLHRARVEAQGVPSGGLWAEYGKSLHASVRDHYEAEHEQYTSRVHGAAALLARAPDYKLSPSDMLPWADAQRWRDYVREVRADGVFSVAEAKSAIEDLTKVEHRREVLLSVGDIAAPEAEQLLVDSILAERPTTRIAGKTLPITLTRSIATLERHVKTLEAEVDALESRNHAKAAEIDQLVRQLNSRKATIEAEYERKRNMGIAFAMFGAPSAALVSLVSMQNDDSRIAEISAALARAQREQASIREQLLQYQSVATPARQTLETLKAAADRLRVVALPVNDATLRPLAEAQARTRAGESLVTNLSAQIEVLTDLKARASVIAGELNRAISELRADLKRAEKLVGDSKKELQELFQLLLDANPELAAQKLLQNKGEAVLKKLMRELGLDVGAHVDALVKKLYPRGGPMASELRKSLMKSVKSVGGVMPAEG